MGTFIVFNAKPTGGDEPGARMAGPMSSAFGVVVAEEPQTVVEALSAGEMAQFQRVWAGERSPVYVNPANVLYVQEQKLRDEAA